MFTLLVRAMGAASGMVPLTANVMVPPGQVVRTANRSDVTVGAVGASVRSATAELLMQPAAGRMARVSVLVAAFPPPPETLARMLCWIDALPATWKCTVKAALLPAASTG